MNMGGNIPISIYNKSINPIAALGAVARRPIGVSLGLALPLVALACAGCAGGPRGHDSPPAGEALPTNAVWLDEFDLSKADQEFGVPHANKSVNGNPIRLDGVEYARGFGTHAVGEFELLLDGAATRFVARVGLDDECAGQGSVAFEVWIDGRKVAETPVLKGGGDSHSLDVDLRGAKELLLLVTDGGDNNLFDHADWAGAYLVVEPGTRDRIQPIGVGDDPPPDIHHPVAPEPAIHGPRVVGATPGCPFLFRVPATGERPLAFAATGLPPGLLLNPDTGFIEGVIEDEGTWNVELSARNDKGTARRSLTIVGGHRKLALTPPLGWNSWNVWGKAVDAEKVRQAADWMVRSGLADHGWQYINIDDAWEAPRGPDGAIRGNEKFPDMKALGDYIHERGLKFGVYSSPGPTTCGGFPGSYQHEQQDALTYAEWGVDYLKYDWCSYGSIAKDQSLEEVQKPYRVMREALDNCGRDVVFSLCQYGMGDVWKWGAEIGGNSWRTSGDIYDSWGSMAKIGFSQADLAPFAAPGAWNDPDMLVVGRVGWGPVTRPTQLKPNEQITHITLWALLASPMLLGCDLSQMDSFTLDLLTNDEVLDVHQDRLGRQARLVWRDEATSTEVWARPLDDGGVAVGLFNRGRRRADITVKWSDLGLTGPLPVRDLWAWRDLGLSHGSFTASVARHGAVLVKIGGGGRPAL